MKLLLFVFISFMPFHIGAQNNAENSSVTRLKYPSNFSELIGPFKGKVIYIDIMASWCKPCLEELKYHKKLDDFFAEKDIIKLFISIDEPESIEKCFQILEKNDMKGFFSSYHSPQKGGTKKGDYIKTIEKMFITYDNEGNFSGMSIPQYIIVDRNGKIAEYKASRPGDKDSLKKQLSSYLDN